MLNGILSAFLGCVVGWTVGGAAMWAWSKWRDKRKAPKELEVPDAAPSLTALVGMHESHSAMPKLRMGVVEAINGRILEVMTAVPHSGMATHYDWKTELYVIPEDQKLSEAIATVMLMKGLEK